MYGYLYGVLGVIIVLYFLKVLEEIKGRYGICFIVVVGGLGLVLLFERV